MKKKLSVYTIIYENISGYSLIELLVVIGILSIIVSIIFPNFMAARQRSRDTQRKSDLIQIQKSMELFKMDQTNPAYPSPSAFPAALCNDCWSSGANCTGNIYMKKFSCDPAGFAPTPYYYDRTDTLNYDLVACLENPADPDKDLTPNPICTITNSSYTVNEP
ncbi:hypothetical protein COV53_05340 [Candidatus Gottesmanbacteria bacterium CG11_big_fil_rev_8_21_14_0_20_37_11]|uniref:Type II secretion system protein GspG C-terminal domain-containing protein n=2 Tax=Candidatus Gottesmaniibacteriota TaxID=1752720 RepID=A0A2M7RRX7_9BACT|nr:MAG: hypothetical protein COX23_06020 [Candidatus Gottesmanbacteria bacterium CG23_combo_of_CG06-09_8_20_14_all_37_19]PIR07994.1 MAG: hypothetical protein COV53_05340 [Candidatus Gottesmanbacteria bacterium CG11_big_fil_rev_8_21_14_0_20_37_11]PIZ02815.1 MAG: hypothetical protein COY59_02835 [Candidatus Gottesmanbacteria bacterium CG_4_10_14_0_8_um_filter_37_24]